MTTILPSWLNYLISILTGVIIGSFLNVVIIRLPKNQSIVRPRSRCMKCGHQLSAWENIPVLSYIVLAGKCRKCQVSISIRYPIIEILCGMLFVACQVRFGWSARLILRDWPFVSLLLAVTFIDLEHQIIPNELSLGGLALGLLTCWISPEPGWLNCWMGAGLGYGVFYLLAWIYFKMNGRAGLGGGDIKLLAMVGSFLGPAGVFATILISSVFGSVVGIGWAWFAGKENMMKLTIPYGPFLVFGALYYYLLGDILWFQFTTPM